MTIEALGTGEVGAVLAANAVTLHSLRHLLVVVSTQATRAHPSLSRGFLLSRRSVHFFLASLGGCLQRRESRR